MSNLVCVILGGGGHAQVLIDSIQAQDAAVIYGVLDRDSSLWGKEVLGVPIVGDDLLLPEVVSRGVNCFAVGMGSTGDNHARKRLFDLGVAYHLAPLTVIHPRAVCSKWARVGAGSQLMPGSIVNAGATVGMNVIVNTGAIVEHDCVLRDHVHVATGARLASTVEVGPGAHVGAGAVVKQCIVIGEGAVVGAGAVVVEDVSAFTVVAGVPARRLREVETQSLFSCGNSEGSRS
ncbi:MAG: hypothetical protein A3G87_05960 [Omnitrophica bacterium RIFCSPLOWO2_12_FULL_50_11]|nr:MAG: hypothetical protein A3G87_05960 [Omnitrophica bacterium RIFCSPLOWO2_12_FULL_50_11]